MTCVTFKRRQCVPNPFTGPKVTEETVSETDFGFLDFFIIFYSNNFLSLIFPQTLPVIALTTPPLFAVQYSTVQYSKVQYSTVQYSTVQYSTVQKKSKLSNFSNFEFYFKFWEKLDEYNQKTMFFSIFPTLRLFFQLCSNFYVLRIWKITISKPLMMES